MAFNKYQGKSKFEPYYLSLAVIVLVSFIVGYLLKKLISKFKGRSNTHNNNYNSFISEEVLYEEVKKEDKKEINEKKKKHKQRIKALTKPTGFIPEEHKLKTKKNDEKSTIVDERNMAENQEIDDKNDNTKHENKTNKDEKVGQISEKKNLKALKKNVHSEGVDSKDNQKSNYLNEFEKNSLYALMGLVSETTPRVYEDSIYSVEYLFEFKSKEKLQLSDKINNSKLVLQCKNVSDHKSLQKVLDFYIETQKKTNIMMESLIALIETALKLEEINHAAFFLTEMDNYNYPIPRKILELFMDLQITQISLKNEIKKKKSLKKKETNKYDKYFNNLINPLTDNFITSPDYFYFNSKRLSYKTMNIENTLKSLALNNKCKPFFPKDKKEESIKKEAIGLEQHQAKMVKESVSGNERVENKEVKTVEEMKDKGNNNIKSDIEDINRKIEIKLKDINFADIKEFYPKNFRILHKNK